MGYFRWMASKIHCSAVPVAPSTSIGPKMPNTAKPAGSLAVTLNPKSLTLNSLNSLVQVLDNLKRPHPTSP